MDFRFDLRNEKEYVLEAMKLDGSNLRYVGEELRNDKEVVLEAVKQNGYSISYASLELRNDKEVLLEAAKQFNTSSSPIRFASEKLKNDEEFLKDCGLIFPELYLEQDEQELDLQSGSIFSSSSYITSEKIEIEKMKKEVHEAVKKKLISLGYSEIEEKKEEEVHEAVENKLWSFRYSWGGGEIKDKEISLEAVKEDGSNLQFASKELRNDKEVVLLAVKQSGISLSYASEELRNDKEVVLEAVKNWGPSLEYASKEMKNDKEVVLEAVKKEGQILQFASKELRNDEEILFSRKFINQMVFPDKFMKKKKDAIIRTITSFEGSFDDLVFHELIGRGVFGGTYLCTYKEEVNNPVKNDFLPPYVVKFYNNLVNVVTEKKEEILGRDSLNIPIHDNIVPILKQWSNVTIDLFKFQDYEIYWKEKSYGQRYIKNCGIILMNRYDTTLNKYLKARKKEESKLLLSIIEFRRIFWGLLCGVCHLHNNMIVHRDLHGENIFLEPYLGRILIGDFGCCLDLRNNETGFKVHKDNDIMFSFTNDTYFKKKRIENSTEQNNGEYKIGFRKGGYTGMAPEIKNFNPKKEEYLDYSKSDIFALGTIGKKIIIGDHLEKKKIIDVVDRFLEFMEKLILEDPKYRLGCIEAKIIGKFIKEEEEVEEEEE